MITMMRIQKDPKPEAEWALVTQVRIDEQCVCTDPSCPMSAYLSIELDCGTRVYDGYLGKN